MKKATITTQPEALLHRIALLELELAQQKLKARRMAIHASYLEAMVKKLKGVTS